MSDSQYELLNKKYNVPKCPCDECRRKRLINHEESWQKKCKQKQEKKNDVGLNLLNQLREPESDCNLVFREKREKWNPLPFKKKKEIPTVVEKPWLKDCCLTCEPPPCEPTSERNFVNFICDGIGVAAFFVLATTMFWLSVAQYAFQGLVAIYKSGRNTRLIALAILGLFLLCLMISLATNRSDKKVVTKKCNLAQLHAVNANDTTQHPLDCEGKPSVVKNNITITITDNCAREVFKQSKLFAIPTEMKQPPALLVYLRDVILRNY